MVRRQWSVRTPMILHSMPFRKPRLVAPFPINSLSECSTDCNFKAINLGRYRRGQSYRRGHVSDSTRPVIFSAPSPLLLSSLPSRRGFNARWGRYEEFFIWQVLHSYGLVTTLLVLSSIFKSQTTVWIFHAMNVATRSLD